VIASGGNERGNPGLNSLVVLGLAIGLRLGGLGMGTMGRQVNAGISQVRRKDLLTPSVRMMNDRGAV
jgi:hypothetical protein